MIHEILPAIVKIGTCAALGGITGLSMLLAQAETRGGELAANTQVPLGAVIACTVPVMVFAWYISSRFQRLEDSNQALTLAVKRLQRRMSSFCGDKPDEEGEDDE